MMLLPAFLMTIRPTRPTFPGDATEAEIAVIARHFDYLKRHFEQGRVTYVGRTMDDQPFGLAVWRAETREIVEALIMDDPAIQGGLFDYELAPFAEIMR